MELPESNNVSEANWEDPKNTTKEDRNKKNDKNDIDDNFAMNNDEQDGTECVDQFSDDEVYTLPAPKSESLVKFRNAAFSWGKASDMLLEVDDLDIPAGESYHYNILDFLLLNLKDNIECCNIE